MISNSSCTLLGTTNICLLPARCENPSYNLMVVNGLRETTPSCHNALPLFLHSTIVTSNYYKIMRHSIEGSCNELLRDTLNLIPSSLCVKLRLTPKRFPPSVRIWFWASRTKCLWCVVCPSPFGTNNKPKHSTLSIHVSIPWNHLCRPVGWANFANTLLEHFPPTAHPLPQAGFYIPFLKKYEDTPSTFLTITTSIHGVPFILLGISGALSAW